MNFISSRKGIFNLIVDGKFINSKHDVSVINILQFIYAGYTQDKIVKRFNVTEDEIREALVYAMDCVSHTK